MLLVHNIGGRMSDQAFSRCRSSIRRVQRTSKQLSPYECSAYAQTAQTRALYCLS